MPIVSYLVHAIPGNGASVASALAEQPGCQVWPASSHDLVVLVVDRADDVDEADVISRLAAVPGVASVSLVAAFAEPADKGA